MKKLRRLTNIKDNLEQIDVIQEEVQTNKNRMLYKWNIQRTIKTHGI